MPETSVPVFQLVKTKAVKGIPTGGDETRQGGGDPPLTRQIPPLTRQIRSRITSDLLYRCWRGVAQIQARGQGVHFRHWNKESVDWLQR